MRTAPRPVTSRDPGSRLGRLTPVLSEVRRFLCRLRFRLNLRRGGRRAGERSQRGHSTARVVVTQLYISFVRHAIKRRVGNRGLLCLSHLKSHVNEGETAPPHPSHPSPVGAFPGRTRSKLALSLFLQVPLCS